MDILREMSTILDKCKICDYTSDEVDITNQLCSVHTCEICGNEGYATGPNGDILCEEHE